MPMEFDVKLEAVKDFLKSTRTASAVYDGKFKLIWSNDGDLFSYFPDLRYKIDSSELPFTKEKTFSVKAAGKVLPLTMTPYYSGKKVIFYICVIHKSENIIELMRKSEIQENARHLINTQYGVIAHIISVANAFEQNLDYATSEQKHDSVMKQIASATLLMSQLNTLNLLWEDDEFEEDCVASVSDLYTFIKDECNEELEQVGRRIEGSREYGNSFVAFSVKRLTIILMNLIQNAFLYSPPKTGVIFNLRFSSGKAVITVENQVAEPEQLLMPVQRSGLSITLIRRAAADINGSLRYNESGGRAEAELILPLVKSANNKNLNAKQREYLHERFKPVHLFLNEVIQKEMLDKNI